MLYFFIIFNLSIIWNLVWSWIGSWICRSIPHMQCVYIWNRLLSWVNIWTINFWKTRCVWITLLEWLAWNSPWLFQRNVLLHFVLINSLLVLQISVVVHALLVVSISLLTLICVLWRCYFGHCHLVYGILDNFFLAPIDLLLCLITYNFFIFILNI